ncbi:hypothetical protein HY469_00185 [Candidatus Roizmanbacteria bacterium]|nr:hypothetical protein [Candidatus Roizmanbacteria bacterium]
MEIIEALYTVLIVCTIAITLVIVMVGYHATLTLQRMQITLEKVEGLTFLPEIVKNSAQAGVFGIAGWILQKLYKKEVR